MRVNQDKIITTYGKGKVSIYLPGWKANIQKNGAHVGCSDDTLQCMFLKLLDLLKAGLLLHRVFERFIVSLHFCELFLLTSKLFLCYIVFAIHVKSCLLQKEEPCQKFLSWKTGSIKLFDFCNGFLEKNLVLQGWNLISLFNILKCGGDCSELVIWEARCGSEE